MTARRARRRLDGAAAAAVEAVGEAQQRGERAEPVVVDERELVAAFGSPRRCQRASAASSWTSSGSKPAELAVADQVRAVLVVTRSATRARRCRGGARRTRAARGRRRRARAAPAVWSNSSSARSRDVARVRLGPVAAAGEPLHRRAPDRAWVVGPVVGVVATDRVEHDPFAQRPLADRHLLEAEQLHRGREEHRAGRDEVDAARFEPVEAQPLGRPSTRGSACGAAGTRRG